MNSLYILAPIALVFVALAIAAFFWAVSADQYEDLDTEGKRILFDERDERSDQNGLDSDRPEKDGDMP